MVNKDYSKKELLLERMMENSSGDDFCFEEYRIEISLPRDKFTDEALQNLKNLVNARKTIMQRAFECADLELVIDNEKISFPWFKPGTSKAIKAYSEFVAAIGEMAIKQVRISSTEKEIVNEKYEFRCFLMKLGFIGDEFKETRKILLQNLSGSSAFRK